MKCEAPPLQHTAVLHLVWTLTGAAQVEKSL